MAPTDSTVLILGETGTGKELLARAVHDLSPRRAKTFVRVNCASIPAGLLESELFGHEKGAFTGAIAQRIGRLELANQGTLFLDEVGDIPLDIQAKLLRALQEKEFERLGSSRTITSDARIVAATNRDLKKMVAAGEFRRDLYYRLNVFPISVPPLRERREDIPLLVQYFLSKYSKRMKKNIDSVPPESMQALVNYGWPGNIRELEHLIERAVILSPGATLKLPPFELEEPADGSLLRARGHRARAHPPRPAPRWRQDRRPRRRGRAVGNESHHAELPHAEAGHHPQRHLTRRRRACRRRALCRRPDTSVIHSHRHSDWRYFIM